MLLQLLFFCFVGSAQALYLYDPDSPRAREIGAISLVDTESGPRDYEEDKSGLIENGHTKNKKAYEDTNQYYSAGASAYGQDSSPAGHYLSPADDPGAGPTGSTFSSAGSGGGGSHGAGQSGEPGNGLDTSSPAPAVGPTLPSATNAHHQTGGGQPGDGLGASKTRSLGDGGGGSGGGGQGAAPSAPPAIGRGGGSKPRVLGDTGRVIRNGEVAFADKAQLAYLSHKAYGRPLAQPSSAGRAGGGSGGDDRTGVSTEAVIKVMEAKLETSTGMVDRKEGMVCKDGQWTFLTEKEKDILRRWDEGEQPAGSSPADPLGLLLQLTPPRTISPCHGTAAAAAAAAVHGPMTQQNAEADYPEWRKAVDNYPLDLEHVTNFDETD